MRNSLDTSLHSTMDQKRTHFSILIVATLSSFLAPFMSSAVNVALPSIGNQFALGAVELNWVATLYLLAAAIFLVPFGRLADLYGRKRIFTIGTLLYTLMSFFIACSPSLSLLYLFRFLQGVGAAMILGNGIALLTAASPVTERGRVLGINAAAVYLGLSLGPFIGGLLTQHFGWRSVFLVNVPIGLCILILIQYCYTERVEQHHLVRFDITGSLLYGLSLLLLLYGFSRIPQLLGWFTFLIGVFLFLAFIVWEQRVPTPLLDISLFTSNRVFAYSNLAAFLNYSTTFAVTFLLSLYLQYVKNISPQTTGTVLVVQPLLMTLCSPFTGKLSDTLEPQFLASLGMAVTTIALILLVFLTASTPLWYVVLCLIVLGIGLALFSSPNTNAVMSSVQPSMYGVASGILGTMRLTGQMFSMGITMVMFALFLGSAQLGLDTLPNFEATLHATFTLFALLCAVGIVASLARGTIH